MDLSAYPWAFWVVIAVVAAVLEMIVPYFTFIFASAGAVVAAAVAVRWGWPLQVGAFCVTLMGSLFLVRPRLLEKFHSSDKVPSRTEALIGVRGQVTQAIDPVQNCGRVSVNGEDWAALSDKPIVVGAVIEVRAADGIKLIVKEI